MISGSTVVLSNDQATIVITRGAGYVGSEMPPSSAGAVRSALRSHAACGGGTASLAAFWAQARGVRPGSQTALIEQVARAVDAGALAAWVMREAVHIPTVEPAQARSDSRAQALETKGAPGAPGIQAAMPFKTPGPLLAQSRAPGAGLDVRQMPIGARFVDAIARSGPLVGPDMAGELMAILRDPNALAAMASAFAVIVSLQTVAAGEVIGRGALAGLVAAALMAAEGQPEALRASRDAVEHFVAFAGLVMSARTEDELDVAGRAFARLVAAAGVPALQAALERIVGRVQHSGKRTKVSRL